MVAQPDIHVNDRELNFCLNKNTKTFLMSNKDSVM